MSAATSSTPPQRVVERATPWPLHDAAATRRLEQAALASSAAGSTMESAGFAVARLALAVAPHVRQVAVLAGPGNNGGDGIVAARWLARQGLAVRVVHIADVARLPADAAAAYRRTRHEQPKICWASELGRDDELLIDALLGLGANRAPDAAIAAAIAALNAHRSPVLAVDLPSGLDADSGRVLGLDAVRARWTLSLLTLKPGLFTAAGREHAGEVWLDPLGVDAAPETAVATLGGASAPALPRSHSQHKGSFGDVVVVGGSTGMAGAMWLAARSALAAGAGRVYVSPLDPRSGLGDGVAPELMSCDIARLSPKDLAEMTVVCGCGGGPDIGAWLPPLLAHAGRLVIDADALNAVARDSALSAALEARGRRAAPTVMTPHPLEAARLLGSDTADVQRRRLAAAQQLADRFAAVVVLKGSGSVVAAPGATPAVNNSGNALLATAGSGDVLAGWIGGSWSARAHQAAGGDALAVAHSAVWLHGRAADLRASSAGSSLPLPASQLIAAMVAAAAPVSV